MTAVASTNCSRPAKQSETKVIYLSICWITSTASVMFLWYIRLCYRQTVNWFESSSLSHSVTLSLSVAWRRPLFHKSICASCRHFLWLLHAFCSTHTQQITYRGDKRETKVFSTILFSFCRVIVYDNCVLLTGDKVTPKASDKIQEFTIRHKSAHLLSCLVVTSSCE